MILLWIVARSFFTTLQVQICDLLALLFFSFLASAVGGALLHTPLSRGDKHTRDIRESCWSKVRCDASRARPSLTPSRLSREAVRVARVRLGNVVTSPLNKQNVFLFFIFFQFSRPPSPERPTPS